MNYSLLFVTEILNRGFECTCQEYLSKGTWLCDNYNYMP